jgi:hypothetical protein
VAQAKIFPGLVSVKSFRHKPAKNDWGNHFSFPRTKKGHLFLFLLPETNPEKGGCLRNYENPILCGKNKIKLSALPFNASQ